MISNCFFQESIILWNISSSARCLLPALSKCRIQSIPVLGRFKVQITQGSDRICSIQSFQKTTHLLHTLKQKQPDRCTRFSAYHSASSLFTIFPSLSQRIQLLPQCSTQSFHLIALPRHSSSVTSTLPLCITYMSLMRAFPGLHRQPSFVLQRLSRTLIVILSHYFNCLSVFFNRLLSLRRQGSFTVVQCCISRT